MITRVLFFTSEECPPGKLFKSVIREITSEKNYNVIEFKIFDINDEVAHEYIENLNVDRVPYTIFLDEKGEPYKKIIGNIPINDLKHILNYELTNVW